MMRTILYCANCSGALMHRNVENKNLFLCPMCGHVYEQTGSGYRHVATLSGGAAVKETINFIDAIKKDED
jgi:DNA-directed RNA polymerase subunit M/transcription elongation factor TFIIS